MLMKKLLENKTPIQFTRECILCKKNNEIIDKITDESIILLEYHFNHNDELKIADVVHVFIAELNVYMKYVIKIKQKKKIDRPMDRN
jgi:hypothetical protein